MKILVTHKISTCGLTACGLRLNDLPNCHGAAYNWNLRFKGCKDIPSVDCDDCLKFKRVAKPKPVKIRPRKPDRFNQAIIDRKNRKRKERIEKVTIKIKEVQKDEYNEAKFKKFISEW